MTEFRTDAAFSTISGTVIPTVEKLKFFNSSRNRRGQIKYDLLTSTISLNHSFVDFNNDHLPADLKKSKEYDTGTTSVSDDVFFVGDEDNESGGIYIISDSSGGYNLLDDATSVSIVDGTVTVSVDSTTYTGTPTPFDGLFYLNDDVNGSNEVTEYYAKADAGAGGFDFFEVDASTGVVGDSVDDPRTETPFSGTATLPDGKYIGQQITLTCSNTSDNGSTVNVSGSGSGLTSVILSSGSDKTLYVLVWDGSEWKTLNLA